MAPPRAPIAISADAWSRWFNRLLQLSGWGLGLYHCVFVRPVQLLVLVFAGALILGGAGIRLFIRGLIGVLESSVDESDRA